MLVMLVSCQKNARLANVARATWLTSSGLPHVVLVADQSQPTFAYDPSSARLTVPCPDDYDNLCSKIWWGLKAARELFEPSGILKVDDDMVVRVEALQAYASAPKADYEGSIARQLDHFSEYHFGKCTTPELNRTPLYVPEVPYCRGGIYYLSRRAVDCLIEHMNPHAHLYEDVLVGQTLERQGIRPRQRAMMSENLADFLATPDYLGYHEAP